MEKNGKDISVRHPLWNRQVKRNAFPFKAFHEPCDNTAFQNHSDHVYYMKTFLFPCFAAFLLIVAGLAKNAQAQTESLYRQFSVQVPTVFRGQVATPPPSLMFTNESCSWSSRFPLSAPPEEMRSQSHSDGFIIRTLNYAKPRICSDFRNFYSVDSMLNLTVALGGGAILANTPLDREFSEWYQDNIKGADGFSTFCKNFGEGGIWLPVFAVSSISYRLFQQSDWNKSGQKYPLGEYTTRTLRGYLVGGPTVLVLQSLLGSERPAEGHEKGSYWRPFHQDHGVSGHAFIGAVPFITAAQMAEKPWLKGVFYFCSVLPAWSRVNDDSHYLSQAILGWYIAYLSARAVSQTEEGRLPKGLTIFPITEGNAFGIGLHYQR